MSDFNQVRGFEDALGLIPRRRPGAEGALTPGGSHAAFHAKLSRVAARAPEVMVKITGRTRDAAHLEAHLSYISRGGVLPLEGRDGERLIGIEEVRELAQDWSAEDLRRRSDSSMSLSVVLSMPAGTSLTGLRDAVATFARATFGEAHDYAFALHSDVDHPHAHLAVRMLGRDGARLNPRKADLEVWRQRFAQALRDREIAAEATTRRARGVIRKAESMPIRKLRDRHGRGDAPEPRVLRAARDEAIRIAKGELKVDRPWERAILVRQRSLRSAYLGYAEALDRGGEGKYLAAELRAFVATMPEISTRRNDLVRQARHGLGERTAPPDERRREPRR